jgi:hypothetical protein
MSGIAYELVPEAEAPDELQPGVSRYVKRDGRIEHYIGDENGNPVPVGRSGVLFAANLHVYKNSSNEKTIYTDVLGLSDISYEVVPSANIGYLDADFENVPDPTRVKVRSEVISDKNTEKNFSERYQQSLKSSGLTIQAYDAAADNSVIQDPGEFHAYVEIIRFLGSS